MAKGYVVEQKQGETFYLTSPALYTTLEQAENFIQRLSLTYPKETYRILLYGDIGSQNEIIRLDGI